MFCDISKCSCNVVGLALNLCLICYLLSMFSNSFVVNEDSVVLFFIQTCLCLQCVIHFKDVLLSFASTSEKKTEKKSERPGNKVKPKPKPKKPLAEGASLRLVVTIVALICLRMTAYFRNCREEQATCQSSIFMDLFSSLASRPDDYFTQMRLTLAFAGLAGICSFVYLSCNKSGNLAGVQVVTICVKLIFPLMCGSMFISWVLQMPLTGNFMKIVDFIWLQQVLFPRFVYIGFITTIILLLWNPLGLCIIFRDKETLESVQATKNTDSEIIQQVFREVRDGLCKRNQSSKSSRNDDESNEKPPLVFGLGNVYSTAYIVITICTALLLITILGDGICFAVFLLMISGYIICKYGRRSEEISKQGVQFSTIIMWSFLASSGFFSTGHQATIPSIRFDAAFVGFQGDTKAIIIPGLLIFLNTFASHVIFAVALPLLSIFTSGVSSYNNSNKTDRIKSQTAPNETGEFFIRENPMPTRVNLFKTMVLYLAVRMLKVSTTAAVAALHRRHLMVWKIFAPRFVFEAASLLCSFPVMVFSFLFFLRVDYCLRKWTTNLEEYIELKYS